MRRASLRRGQGGSRSASSSGSPKPSRRCTTPRSRTSRFTRWARSTPSSTSWARPPARGTWERAWSRPRCRSGAGTCTARTARCRCRRLRRCCACAVCRPSIRGSTSSSSPRPAPPSWRRSPEGFVARWPALSPERVGWGEWGPARSTIARTRFAWCSARRPYSRTQRAGDYALVEANVDDLTGELAAHAIRGVARGRRARRLGVSRDDEEGPAGPRALGVAICRDAAQEQVSATLLRETSSIGVRRSPVTRTERPRRAWSRSRRASVEFRSRSRRARSAPPQVKPEFDACARAAREHGATVREVIAAALAAFAAR